MGNDKTIVFVNICKYKQVKKRRSLTAASFIFFNLY